MVKINVSGYKHISFWRESNTGIIVLKTDNEGSASVDIIQELISALGLALGDERVRSLAITGENNNFLTGLTWIEGKHVYSEVIDLSHTLANMLAAFPYPVFSLVNGRCLDYGYEIALLSDYIIARPDVQIGFNDGYHFMFAGSLTWNKFRFLGTGQARERVNVDKIIESEEEFLSESQKFIERNSSFDFMSVRKLVLGDLQKCIAIESEQLLRFYYGAESRSRLNEKEG